MSSVGLCIGEIINYLGQRCEVVSNKDGFITLKLTNGRNLCVSIAELMKTSLWEYREEREKERSERISYFRKKAEEAYNEVQIWSDKLKDLNHQMSKLAKDSIEYIEIKKESWRTKFKKTAASNSEYSYCMSAFMVASDPIT